MKRSKLLCSLLTSLIAAMLFLGPAYAQINYGIALSRDDCSKNFSEQIRPDYGHADPRLSYALRPIRGPVADRYADLHWYTHGLEATMANPAAQRGVAKRVIACQKRPVGCEPFGFKPSKSTAKDAQRFIEALESTKASKGKDIIKYKKRLLNALPERLPETFPSKFAEEESMCGFTESMIAAVTNERSEVFETSVQAAPREVQEMERLCKLAKTNFENAKATRPDTLYFVEKMWAERYGNSRESSNFCMLPPMSLVNDVPYGGSDPFGDMPFDYLHQNYRKVSDLTAINPESPTASDCETVKLAANIMVSRQKKAKLRPEEKEWIEGYVRGTMGRGLCSTIPPRLADWGNSFVATRGWQWPLSSMEEINYEDCKVAIEKISAPHLGQEYLRWRATLATGISNLSHRRESGQCSWVPKSFATELRPIISQQRSRIASANARAELQRLEEAAKRPASLQELLEDFNQSWVPPQIIEERCYMNTYGREHCYTKG